MPPMRATCTLPALLLLPVVLPAADLALADVFSDHAVLQRDQPVPVWGTADPAATVTVSFAGQTKTGKAGADGRWMVRLEPLRASDQAAELTVTAGPAKVVRKDLLVGEVWLASGQSNMASPLSSVPDAPAIMAKAGDAQLRFLTVPKRTAAEPATAIAATWNVASPDSVKGLSAVGYFFARDLRQARKVPVGLVVAAWGGTSIQTWMSLEALRQEPPLTKFVKQWDDAVIKHREVQADPSVMEAYRKDLKQFQAEVAALKKTAGPTAKPERPEPVNPDPMDIPSPSRRPSTPTVNSNGLIAPLVPYALSGFLWYQGENDGSFGRDYRTWLPRLIGDWRTRWARPEAPFLIVQLPANGPDTALVAEKGWPFLREAQCMALSVPNTGMAITIDVGNPKDVHPAGKEPVGQRLALLARRIAYGEKTLVASGPLYEGFQVQPDGKVRITFRETGGGLVPGQSPWYAPGVEPYPQDRLIGFVIAGADRQWREATAVVDGRAVLVSHPEVPKPVAVRYGWAASPRCNLYNREGLPAGPFRTDGD